MIPRNSNSENPIFMNRPLPGSDGEHRLQERHGTRDRALAFYDRQVIDHLNERMIDYLTRQTLMFVATADAGGECDCSLRAGPPGFVHVLDERTLVYPEYRGNGVMASLGNIEENPHAGLFFGDFLDSTIGLHVNGRASILENEELGARPDLPETVRKALAIEGGLSAERWVCLEVEEAYIHCSKHIPRLALLDKKIQWGVDDEAAKGGDFFGVGEDGEPT